MTTAALSIGFYGEELDLLVRQGAEFGPVTATMRNPDASPVDLTGCAIRGQVRKRALDASTVASLTVTITNAANGVYEFGMSNAVTAGIPAGEAANLPTSQYVWDLELQDVLGRVIPLYYGAVIVLREVTR